jgi:hypothetical protein
LRGGDKALTDKQACSIIAKKPGNEAGRRLEGGRMKLEAVRLELRKGRGQDAGKVAVYVHLDYKDGFEKAWTDSREFDCVRPSGLDVVLEQARNIHGHGAPVSFIDNR